MKRTGKRRPLLGPERTCLGCGGKFDKGGLLRFVVRAGVLVVDHGHQLPGRGGYCCRREKCLKNFTARKGRLTRALRSEVVDCLAVAAISADGFGGGASLVANLAGDGS